MSLRTARLHGQPVPLPPGPPYPCAALGDWISADFELEPGDERLAAPGGPAPEPAFDNLLGARAAWREHPEWMDFLDPAAPNHAAKLLERELYLSRWRRFLPPPGRALDVGAGIGRFSLPLLAEGWEVQLADPDLESLRRAARHARGTPGRLDLHWTTGERLPALDPVDLVLAAEVLCYAADPAAIVAAVVERLRPGGLLLCSVEARWGWALAPDTAPGTLGALLRDGVVHVPGDRWVRTFEAEDLRDLLHPLEILELVPTHYIPSGPFEAAAGPLGTGELLALEQQLRVHPKTSHLHRAWTAVARRKT